MKRKIELPNIGTIYHKQHDGIGLTVLEKLFCELDDDSLYMAAVQEAYNQGYEDGRGSIVEDVLEACEEWSGWVEVDTAPRTLRKHIELVINGEEE